MKRYSCVFDLDIREKAQINPLMMASFAGDARGVKNSLETGICDIDERDDTMRTGLMYAGMGGHVDCMKYLINAGASVNSADRMGITALMYVTIHGDRLGCLELLVNAGASINVRDKKRKAALSHAIEYNRTSCTEALLNSGADVDAVHGDGDTFLGTATLKARIRIMNLLLAKGASVNQGTTTLLRSPLMISGENGNERATAVLLKAGAEVNQCDRHGRTALIIAASQNRYKCVKLLLEKGANVRVEDVFGKNALMYAANGADYECVRDLIDAGADATIVNRYDETALAIYLHSHCWGILCLQGPSWISPAGQVCHTEIPRLSGMEWSVLKLLCECGSPINHSTGTALLQGRLPRFLPTDLYFWLHAAGHNMELFNMHTSDQGENDKDIEHDVLASMKELCRNAIRNHLLNLDRYSNLFRRVPLLGLPTPLARYLVYNHGLLSPFERTGRKVQALKVTGKRSLARAKRRPSASRKKSKLEDIAERKRR